MIRTVARWAAEFALVWLLAAATTASFAPRGVGFDATDHFTILPISAVSGLLVALPAAGICFGLWWLLQREYLAPLAVGAAAVLIVALLIPHGLAVYFVPPPLVLLAAAWVLRWNPRPPEEDRER